MNSGQWAMVVAVVAAESGSPKLQGVVLELIGIGVRLDQWLPADVARESRDTLETIVYSLVAANPRESSGASA